eukprot:TRINITY_DN3580_c0_g1_i1.p1 TRINITY_DN3580_c0_g1~~TRINITY_DN3580_c0_g1_i1.p1  ORF type:complete len:139 (-),score=10.06 TRINITY_DN3580_c0_g1_i1:99-515(-)
MTQGITSNLTSQVSPTHNVVQQHLSQLNFFPNLQLAFNLNPSHGAAPQTNQHATTTTTNPTSILNSGRKAPNQIMINLYSQDPNIVNNTRKRCSSQEPMFLVPGPTTTNLFELGSFTKKVELNLGSGTKANYLLNNKF